MPGAEAGAEAIRWLGFASGDLDSAATLIFEAAIEDARRFGGIDPALIISQ